MTLQPFDSNAAKRIKSIFNVKASVEHITSLPAQGDGSGNNGLTLNLIYHRRIHVSSHFYFAVMFFGIFCQPRHDVTYPPTK